MRSPPPEGRIRLYVLRVGDDDPKACTGRRLLLRGLASAPPGPSGRELRRILLDPYAKLPISGADRIPEPPEGILAIDCSWNRLSSRGRFADRPAGRLIRRRLPWLLAANPQHFGRPTELNTAEALAAALYILGEPERARTLAAMFPGGANLFALNEPAISEYAAAQGPDEVRAVERRRFGGTTEARTPAPPS